MRCSLAFSVAVTALTTGGLAACTAGGAEPGARLPAASGRIAFSSDRAGNGDIYSVDPDGSGLLRLTDDPAWDYAPLWSPDGGRIAFVRRTEPNNEDIYVLDADGSGLRRLTANPGLDTDPTWSPDATRIAYESSRGGDNPEVHVVNVDGSEEERLTRTFAAKYPSWSPDGTRIAFVMYQFSFEDVADVFVMNADGSNLAPLTHDEVPEGEPRWSPDGRRILFTRRDGIYLVNADGSDLRRVIGARDVGGGQHPAWSPDGSRIAFVNAPGKVSVVHSDGSGLVQLTDDRAPENWPMWSPDGTRLAFQRFDLDGSGGLGSPSPEGEPGLSGTFDLYVVNADGSGLARLTDHPASDEYPSWQPLPR